ncbi:MAG: PQQ-binding-like beta-propeller repeat protein [Verrucomicrobiales bacterium]|nr:PQQ-binding-like beta-propeller repeat protein [Verrucomicrobiales bacterium]
MKGIPVAILSVHLGMQALVAGNWPNWRGPSYDGAAAPDEKGLPVKFSASEGVAWSVDLPGAAASTPVVWGDSVFATCAVESEEKLYAYCVDRKTGSVRWKREMGAGYRADDRSNYASPSPVTDGKVVVFYFGTGELAAFDFSGRQVWRKNLQQVYGRFATQWTYSSSPMLADGRLVIQVLQRNVAFEFNGQQKGEKDKPNDSYVVALEPATGKELWKVIRPSGANAESLEAFSTPVPAVHNGRAELLVTGGDCITGHDPASGRELWRWESWNPEKISHWRLVPSAVAGEGIALACAPKREPVYAFKMGANGPQKEEVIAWTTADDERRDVSSDVSTPLYYQGRFYVLNSDRKSLACVEPKSGRVLWNERLEAQEVRLQKFESSPTAADGKIYMIDHRGTVVVAAAGDKFRLLAVNPMGGNQDQFVRSSIAISGGCLFIRTSGRLFCVGKS